MDLAETLHLFERYLGPGKQVSENMLYRCPNPECKGRIWVSLSKDGYPYHCFHCNERGNGVTFARKQGEACPSRFPPVLPARPAFDWIKAARIYTALFQELRLQPDHVEFLRERRGISSPLDYGLRTAGRRARQIARRFPVKDLAEVGLWRNGNASGPARCLDLGRILIPYRRGSDVLYFRSYWPWDKHHPKYLSPAGVPSRNYSWGEIPEGCGDLIITEGEFKAMVAVDRGFPCVALPGMAVGHAALVERVAARKVRRAVVCFDEQQDHQSLVDAAAESLCARLERAGVPTYRARLPRREDEAKIDIDAFLLREGPEAFQRVLDRAERSVKP